MVTGIIIGVLVFICWTLFMKVGEEENAKLMWENRAIRLISEVNRETGRQYYFVSNEKDIIGYIEKEQLCKNQK